MTSQPLNRILMSQSPKNEILQRLRSINASSKPIIGAGAGSGISAKFLEEGGIDLLVLYNSGKFRMAGRGSLAGLMPYVRHETDTFPQLSSET